MGSSTGAEYAEFQHRVRRTVYVDSLSPLVTESVMRTALGQFGTVNSVQFIPNFLGPEDLPTCALVEMADAKEARAVVSELTQLPFMIVGMPRPVRARFAEPEMFGDNPPTPGRNIECRWLDQNDPNFETLTKMKKLVLKHSAESKFLIEQQVSREEVLAKKQSEMLAGNYEKLHTIQAAFVDHSFQKLARRYKLNAGDR